jgi:alkylation response protein AidB-like acyl-CoA dehydrogenase
MMIIPQPSQHIVPELAAALRNVAAEAEQLKNLHPVQLAIVYEQQWLQLFVPKQYNGLELGLPAALQLEETLAWVDGAVGWTVTLCAGAGWFVGFLDPEIAALIFSEKNACLAGSGKASGIAKKTVDGYEITGSWDYASGANHATAFTANCQVEENGVLLQNADGSSLIQAFVFLNTEVTIQENWKRIGMIATGSHSFSVNKLAVRINRGFTIDKQCAVLKSPIYQYPFLQFAETTLAVNSSGMALRFLELCTAIFQKTNNSMEIVAGHIAADLEKIRQDFYAVAITSWEQCCNNTEIDEALLQQVSHASRQLAISSRKAVDELYPYCGMQAANPDTEINRVWRNLHTASQHSLFNR